MALVTGGTGLLGSHIAERLAAAGVPVRALVRPSSDVRHLRGLGVELVRGDLTDPASCDQALDGVEVVFHAASKVGDWGSWAEFERDCVAATESLGRAAAAAGVKRFLHVSSTSAYGHPREGGPAVEETDELGQNLWAVWDYYTRSKVEQERRLWALAETAGLELTIVRPSWLYGERDRTTTERVVKRLRAGGMPLIGRGDNPLSAIYAGEVAAAAILAAGADVARGQAYNVTDLGPITQREFFNLWAEAARARPVRSRRAYSAVFAFAFALEAAARLTRRRKPPLITRYATWLMGRELRYSTEKARRELGWIPATTYRTSIASTVAWYLEASGRHGSQNSHNEHDRSDR